MLLLRAINTGPPEPHASNYQEKIITLGVKYPEEDNS